MNFRLWLLFTASLVTCTFSQTATTTTPSAKCVFQEPRYNGTFDLTGIRSTHAHIYSLPGTGDFTFNMCEGTNPTDCNNVKGTGACFKEAGLDKEHVLGFSSGEGVMRDGIIYFNYVGEKCDKDEKKNYTLEIIAECDYHNELDPISLIKRDSCDFMLRYKSAKACMQTTVKSQCQFKLAQNKNFNLAELPKGNQRIETPDREFFISLCRPVIYTPASACPPDTNVCVYDKKKQEFSSAGGPDVVLLHDEDYVALNYSSSTKCDVDPTMNMSTIINFKCDPTQTNKISFVGTAICTHIFEWFTPLGCDKNTACATYDSGNDVTYDLRSLMGKSYNVSRNGTTYKFGICSAPEGCATTAGACNSATGYSLGALNKALTYNETGYPFLKYENGLQCKSGALYFTKIEFTCAKTEADEGKMFILEDTDCRLIIQFATRLVCPPLISCKDSYMGQSFDLTPLINPAANYEAVVADELKKGANKDAKFYLNVCRPLAPEYGLSCQGGSAVCRANVVNGKPENETSLGYPDVSLTVVNSSENIATPQLKYLHGDACPGHSTETASSTINFKCNAKAGRGRPVLKEVEDECHFMFHWETNVICKDTVAEYKGCALRNAETDGEFNLAGIGKAGVTELVQNVKVNLCNLSEITTEIQYANQIAFLRAAKTDVKDVSVEMVLECRGDIIRNERRANPKDNPYKYTIIYIDPAVCKLFGAGQEIVTSSTTTTTTTATSSTTLPPNPSEGPSTASTTTTTTTTTVAPAKESTTTTPKDKAPTPPDRAGMSAWGIMGVIFLVCGIFVAIGLVLRSPHRRAQVLSLFRRKNVAVSYTRVSNEEAASSLLMAPAGLSESDDELLV